MSYSFQNMCLSHILLAFFFLSVYNNVYFGTYLYMTRDLSSHVMECANPFHFFFFFCSFFFKCNFLLLRSMIGRGIYTKRVNERHECAYKIFFISFFYLPKLITEVFRCFMIRLRDRRIPSPSFRSSEIVGAIF